MWIGYRTLEEGASRVREISRGIKGPGIIVVGADKRMSQLKMFVI